MHVIFRDALDSFFLILAMMMTMSRTGANAFLSSAAFTRGICCVRNHKNGHYQNSVIRIFSGSRPADRVDRLSPFPTSKHAAFSTSSTVIGSSNSDNHEQVQQQQNMINPTVDWKGSSHSTSEFVTHVLIPPEATNQTVGAAVEHVVVTKQQENAGRKEESLSAKELLAMGSVWYLPASAPRDPSLGGKPRRLSDEAYDQPLVEGDYLRVHHHPRRFKAVYDFDWNARIAYDTNNVDETKSSEKPGVIVDEDKDKGWLVIDKPARVPVHMTVDNCRENVQACLVEARQNTKSGSNDEEEVYVTTPQRLDQNTSGLFVVATSPTFAAYYAQLLQNKTSLQLKGDKKDDERIILGGIHKVYRCLVCLQPNNVESHMGETWSVARAYGDLKTSAEDRTIIRHYLEPSIRAPKNFVRVVPLDHADSNAWLECLLRIHKVGPLYSLVGNVPSMDLAQALWSDRDRASSSGTDGSPARMPPKCQAVVEIQVELLTGRTHQIRGQLAAMGYPLVGDVQYGGAEVFEEWEAYKSFSYERLALQCCQLEFVDPDLVTNDAGVRKMIRTKRWNKFNLARAWWSSFLEAYDSAISGLGTNDATTDASNDIGITGSPQSFLSTSTNAQKPPRPDLLPDRVQLSPGKNKYVVVRASHPFEPDTVHWFVKSSTPGECGGPYHGNVAQDLREWIEAAGFDVVVTGGGRIDYSPNAGRCVVYGFSYGFGKGDHALAARVICEHSQGKIAATFDNTDGLY